MKDPRLKDFVSLQSEKKPVYPIYKESVRAEKKTKIKKILIKARKTNDEKTKLDTLSNVENAILELMCNDLSVSEIAKQMDRQKEEIYCFIRGIKWHYNVKTTSGLISAYLKSKMLF